MIRLVILCIGVLSIFATQAQEVSFKTYSGAKQVVVGSTFDVTFSIENADEKHFKPPNFAPFKRIAGPSQSYQSTFINGKSSKSISYAYTLQATNVGTFEIKGAAATINGKVMTSNPIQIEVVKQATNLAQESETAKIFIRAELDTTHLYVGQQVLLKYKIYTQVNIENYNIIAESSYDGCFTQVLDAYKDRAIKEVIDGEEYTTKVLRKVAVFPQQNGKISIEPLAVRVGIPDRTKRRRSFFSSFNLKTKNISSNAVELYVKSPHQNAPENFTGAVGTFSTNFLLHPNSVTTDDVINLRVKIVGNGDVKMIRPPKIDLPASFEAYDPKVLDEKMITTRDSVRGEKIIEYLILGNSPGKFVLKPNFTYLNPGLSKFETVRDSFAITIKQGKSFAQSDNSLNRTSDQQLAEPMMSTSLVRNKPAIIGRPWYWTVMGLPVLGFMLLAWHKRNGTSGELYVDHTAIAQQRLVTAKQHLDDHNAQAFYEELAFCIKKYLTSKFGLPAAQQSKESIRQTLQGATIEAPTISRLTEMLDQSDYALYAGIHDPSLMEAAYQDAVEIIKSLEHQIQA